jgi:hypothetical protein
MPENAFRREMVITSGTAGYVALSEVENTGPPGWQPGTKGKMAFLTRVMLAKFRLHGGERGSDLACNLV